MTLQVELITDVAALAALRDDWRALSASVPENTDFYATWDYTHAYLEQHLPASWVVVALRETATGRLAAVFPFTLYQLAQGGRHYQACQPLGMGYLAYIDYPVRSQLRRDVVQVLLNTALRERLKIDVAIFWPLHERSMFYLTLVEDLGSNPVLKKMRFINNLHEIETRGLDFARFREACSSTSFRDAAYCRRRFERMGDLRFTLSEPVAACRPLAAWLCDLNQKKFPGIHVYRHLPGWADFVPHLLDVLVPRGLAQLSTLRLDGEPIAGSVSFLHKRRRYFHLIDYEPRFVALSPSKILIAELIGATFDEGGVFCFGPGGMPYKATWTQSVGELKGVVLFFDPTARSALEPQMSQTTFGSLGSQ